MGNFGNRTSITSLTESLKFKSFYTLNIFLNKLKEEKSELLFDVEFEHF